MSDDNMIISNEEFTKIASALWENDKKKIEELIIRRIDFEFSMRYTSITQKLIQQYAIKIVDEQFQKRKSEIEQKAKEAVERIFNAIDKNMERNIDELFKQQAGYVSQHADKYFQSLAREASNIFYNLLKQSIKNNDKTNT